MKCLREIKAVGLLDWCWFVFYLRRDENSEKLRLLRYRKKKNFIEALQKDRARAHNIDMALASLGGKPKQGVCDEGGEEA